MVYKNEKQGGYHDVATLFCLKNNHFKEPFNKEDLGIINEN
jgi:hypothetical protein